jgi:hypothetical protein
MIYEQAELLWNGIDRRKPLIFSPEISNKVTSRHLEANQKELAKEIMDFALLSIILHTSKGFLIFRKILQYGTKGFTSAKKEGVLRTFLALKIPCRSTGFEAADFRSHV